MLYLILGIAIGYALKHYSFKWKMNNDKYALEEFYVKQKKFWEDRTKNSVSG